MVDDNQNQGQSGNSGEAPQQQQQQNPPQTPQVVSPQPQQQTATQSPSVDFAKLVTAIEALPERITNGVAEAVKPPAPQKQEPQQQGTQVTQEKPKRKNLAEWWFG